MCTILAIDDEPGFLQIIKVVLERRGYQVVGATDGRSGLELVEQQRPDVIILDEMMPGLSGTEVCQTLKSDPKLASIPVVLHTARQFTPEQSAEIGADALLRKPSLPTDILAVVDHFTSVQV